MTATIKSILDEFCDRINQPRESAYVTSSQPAARQYVSLFKFIGDDLRNRPYQWPQLKRNWLFLTQTNVRNYPYPGDFYRPLEGTQFDDSNQIPMLGAISDRNYAIRSVGIISLQTQKAYQILGKTSGIIHSRTNNEYNGISASSDGYFRIDPPGPSETDLLSMGYLSKNYMLPAAWVKSTSYTAANKVSVNGQIYTCTVSGTSSAVIPPSVFNGIGSDGGTVWAACIAFNNPSSIAYWTTATQYTAGQYIYTLLGNFYLCTTGGLSGASEPTDTSDAVTDGTVVWQYIAPVAWAANTQYAYGDYVYANITIPGGATFTQLFQNVAINPFESVSGTYSPSWYWDQGYWYQADATVLWLWQNTEFVVAADTDLCLFDKEVMTEGMRWAWYRAKKQDYQQERIDWEQSLRSAYSRFEAPCAVNAANGADSAYPWPNVPLGSWPGTGDI
jgi:hypothetical protein